MPRYSIWIIDPSDMIKVKRIKWIISILAGEMNNSWKILARSYLSCLDNDFTTYVYAVRTFDTNICFAWSTCTSSNTEQSIFFKWYSNCQMGRKYLYTNLSLKDT